MSMGYLVASFALLGLLSSPAWAGPVGQKKCGTYQMILKGKTSKFHETMILEKVSKSGGADGRWEMTKYEQKHFFKAPIPGGMGGKDHYDMGHGMWMDVSWHMTGYGARAFVTKSKVKFDIANNKIGYHGTNVWLGTISGKQVTFNWPTTQQSPFAATLKGTVRLDEGGETVKIDIQMPPAGDRIFFDEATPGKFELQGKAIVTPASYANQLKWTTSKMDGVDINVSGTGTDVKIVYKKLPKDNNQFGKQKITASLDIDGCEVEADVPIEVYYIRNAKNNPEGKDPNWFYYWKQTGAAKPEGQSIDLQYGGMTFDVCANVGVAALFKPGHGLKTVHVCDLNRFGHRFKNRYPLLDRNAWFKKCEGFRTSRDIDTFATAVLHEYQHLKFYHNWKAGKSNTQLNLEDTDGDGIPDRLEPDMNFDPKKKQTHCAEQTKKNEFKSIGWDEEWLAYEAMRKHQHGIYDKYDWSFPGVQWSN